MVTESVALSKSPAFLFKLPECESLLLNSQTINCNWSVNVLSCQGLPYTCSKIFLRPGCHCAIPAALPPSPLGPCSGRLGPTSAIRFPTIPADCFSVKPLAVKKLKACSTLVVPTGTTVPLLAGLLPVVELL